MDDKYNKEDKTSGLFPDGEDYEQLSSELSFEEEKQLLFKAVELAEQDFHSDLKKDHTIKKRKKNQPR